MRLSCAEYENNRSVRRRCGVEGRQIRVDETKRVWDNRDVNRNTMITAEVSELIHDLIRAAELRGLNRGLPPDTHTRTDRQ